MINTIEYRRRDQRDLCHITEGPFLLFRNRSMIDKQMFHIYDRATNKPVKVCMTTDELEQMLAKKEVDFVHWEVQPCYNIPSSEEQSY